MSVPLEHYLSLTIHLPWDGGPLERFPRYGVPLGRGAGGGGAGVRGVPLGRRGGRGHLPAARGRLSGLISQL